MSSDLPLRKVQTRKNNYFVFSNFSYYVIVIFAAKAVGVVMREADRAQEFDDVQKAVTYLIREVFLISLSI